MSDMNCDEVRELLPAYAGGGDVSLALRRHIARCPGCRGEFEAYETLRGALAESRMYTVTPPAGLAAAMKQIPAADDRLAQVRDHLARNRAAYAGGAAVALGAAGALQWRARRHGTALA